MENKKFELNDDALDAVSGGTAGTPSNWRVGKQIEAHSCPCCREGQVTGTIERLIYRKTTLGSLYIHFHCCGQRGVLDADAL